MTLLTTEIHHHNQHDKALIVFAADRRISAGGAPRDERPKIFRVPDMPAGIGYFGLAETVVGSKSAPMSEWLEDFLAISTHADVLGTLANMLLEALKSSVPLRHQKSHVSGFHLCGFNRHGQPEFWYVRNVGDDRKTMLGEYQIREDFQRRDARAVGQDEVMIYRNGDLRAHVAAWEDFDKSLGTLLNYPDFRQLASPEDYLAWVKFKMSMIASFYRAFCTQSIIGGEIDAFVITNA